MADEELTIAPSEPAPEPTIATEQDAPIELLEPGETEDEQTEGGEEQAVEFVTIERNGKQYQVPKELENEFMMQADYTRKRQADAEKAKELDQRAAQLDQYAKATEDDRRDYAAMLLIDERLQQYANVDWNTLEQQDPIGAQSPWRQYQQLEKARGEAQQNLAIRQQERSRAAQQDFAKRAEEAHQFAVKNIPGWSDEMGQKVLEHAIGSGVPKEFIANNLSPTLLKILHLAFVGDQASRKIATAAQPKPTNVTPLTTVKPTGGTVRKSLADLAEAGDMEAFSKAWDARQRR